MNLQELDSYNLADAVKFNKQLNPRLWQKEQMRPEVRDKLLEIAADFKEFLGLSDLEVKDITVSGSNAGYTYTPYSDIDLHLVVDIPQADSDDVYRELFDAKKYQYNDLHNIKIGGYDVELYVENANKPPVSQGVFSVLNNDWINIPRYRKSTVDDDAVRSKYEDFKHRIDDAVKSNDMERIDSLARKIKTYRQAGLDAHGELGPENLAYKMLRTQGYITKLYDAKAAARDAELSLAEQNKVKVKKPFIYGYKHVAEDATATPDGVGASTRMFLSEKPTPTQEEIIRDFLNFAVEELEIDNVPKLRLKKDPEWSIRNKSFGRYDAATGELIVALGNRHIMDILRTLAHELTHRKQDETESMPLDAGETGSAYENEANARAGVLMRDYAGMHPEYFEDVAVNEASGYIPTRAQAKDPRFNMALTVDVHPGQTGKEANKMALKTDKQGKPELLIKSANLQEATAKKSYGYNSTPLSQAPGEQEDELGNQEATGPEFEPQMPAGTTKVDVTDLTDWYRLGMDISDMDDADPKDYNQGPPQTVITFPSDEAEQGYLKQFKRLGLKTHDLDPDVEGGEDVTGKHLNKALAEELQAFKEQDLFEVKMTSKNLANLAKDIKGAKVGLEFEMYVPNVSNDEDRDQEPDYDQDERVRDIDDAVNFFDDGDYNGRNEIRRLREQMESDYFDWQTEQIDQDWHNNGFEFFQEYLDREEPFDPEDYQERAEDEVKADYPDLDPTSEEFGELVAEKLREINAEYYVETWEAQGRSYDYAQEEFEAEKRDEYSESDWLDSISISYASDVEGNYGNVVWPYYTSSSDSAGDIENVALDFMNAMGMDSVAYSSNYHGYGGGYKKWVGNGWVSVGSNKPDDCFTIEPDGSLDTPDNEGDTGLEFVSPPIPLEDIGTVMKKVQAWAADNGVYTGKNNKTSMHTNISIPGYDLDKLDYLKAALLLGDEHVLRQFDRIGNSYAKPAIEKVKQLARDKPEKAKELLDKMKSHLDAAASKILHSGVTDKFTSINTKDNRIEFRSPGGDYLTDIAENPKKMQDTINRMVVAMDAAMDPNKYKEEYQKKLYKVLTGDIGSRRGKTGEVEWTVTSNATVWDKDTRRQMPAFKTNVEAKTAKEAWEKVKANLPADSTQSEYSITPNKIATPGDKDLLNIFSRYAAGEMPKAALKSFLRQAQLQRKVAKGENTGKMWWNVKYNGQRMEVVADNESEAKTTAAREWGLAPGPTAINSMTAEPLRPYEEKPQTQGTTVAGRPNNPDGDWYLKNGDTNEIFYRFNASDYADAYGVLQQWKQENPNSNINAMYGHGRAEPTPQGGGTYRITTTGGGLIAGDEYGNDQTALQRAQYWAQRRDVDVVVRNPQGQEVGRVSASGEITPTAQPPAQQNQGNWGIWINANDRFANQPGTYSRGETPPLYRFPSQEAAESWIEQQRAERPNMRTDIEVREIEPAQQSSGVNNLIPHGPGPWELASMANNQVYFNPTSTDRQTAETEARAWIQQTGLDPAEFVVRTRESVSQQAPNWEIRDGSTNRLVHQFYAPDRQEAAIIAGDFYDDNDFVGDNYTVQSIGSGADAAQGGIITTANEPATGSQVGQTYNPSGTGSFTGQWLILNPNNQVIYRFGGIGNAQSDANRIAMAWLTQNPQQLVDGVTVVPEMG
jgi:hypothetical protein